VDEHNAADMISMNERESLERLVAGLQMAADAARQSAKLWNKAWERRFTETTRVASNSARQLAHHRKDVRWLTICELLDMVSRKPLPFQVNDCLGVAGALDGMVVKVNTLFTSASTVH
jgi:hypothetical protein